jgi:hypothetical protein
LRVPRSYGIVVALVVIVSAAVRWWATRGIVSPLIAPDEMVYSLLGRGLYRHGSLTILGGPTGFYSLVVPVFVGLPLSLGDLELGYRLLKLAQAVAMSLAAVPVYLWGRTLMPRRWALVAAVCTVALPGLAYSGLVLSEVEFYPLLICAAWAAAATIARPSRRNVCLSLIVFALVVLTRLQALALAPAFVGAMFLDAAIARSRQRLATAGLALGAIGLVAAIWVGVTTLSGRSPLGAYESAFGSYSFGSSAHFVIYDAADVALFAGIFPVCALFVLVWRSLRSGEHDAKARAFVAVSISVVVSMLLEVGVFSSRHVDVLAERNLIALAPILFLGFALWLARGGPGGQVERSVVGLAVGACVLALPLRRFVVDAGRPDSPTVSFLLRLERAGSYRALEVGLDLAVVAAVCLFVILRRRALVLLPAIVVALLVWASFAESHVLVSQAKAQELQVLGPHPRWIDQVVRAPVAFVYDGSDYWATVWENEFWNTRIQTVYDLPQTNVSGPMPQQQLSVLTNGDLRLGDGSPARARFAVGTTSFTYRGTPIATTPLTGGDRQGLILWRLEQPFRLSTIVTGLEPYGQLLPTASLHVYGCASGSFHAVLLVKQQETIRVTLDGRLVRTAAFAQPGVAHVDVPVPASAAGENRICVFKVSSDGLLAATQFEFDRYAANTMPR